MPGSFGHDEHALRSQMRSSFQFGRLRRNLSLPLVVAAGVIFTIGPFDPTFGTASAWAQSDGNPDDKTANSTQPAAQNQDDTTSVDPTDSNSGDTADPNALTTEQAADLEVWKATLLESANVDARLTAATRLLQSGWAEANTVLVEVLQQSDSTADDARRSVLDAITTLDQVPPQMLLEATVGAYIRATPARRESIVLAVIAFPHMEAIAVLTHDIHDAANQELATRLVLIELLSRFVEVETVDALILCLDAQEDPAIRQAAQFALESMTSITHNGSTRMRWANWWTRVRAGGREGLLDASVQRQRTEIRQLRDRERVLLQDRTELTNALIIWMERSYALTPTEKRPALLVTFLHDPKISIRLLGFQLIEQAMANADPITPEVVDAVAACVSDTDGHIRAEALHRLRFINAAQAAQLAAQRLATESDEAVRLAMYTILAQEPTAAPFEALLERWAITPGRSGLSLSERSGLASVFEAYLQSKILTEPAKRNAVLAPLSKSLAENPGVNEIAQLFHPDEIRLLAWYDDPLAQTIVLSALQSVTTPLAPETDPAAVVALRLAAATGLAASGLNDEALFGVADEVTIHPIAITALHARFGPLDALGRLLTTFACPSEAIRTANVRSLMATLPIEHWLVADDLLANSSWVTVKDRAAWLSRVRVVSNANVGGGNGNTNPGDETGGGDHDVQSQGMLRRALFLKLAELELLQGQPENAITALEDSPVAESDQDRFTRLQLVAHIAAGQFVESENTPAPEVGVWVEALDVVDRIQPTTPEATIATTALRRTIALRIRAFGDEQLSESVRSRIAGILGAIQVESPDASRQATGGESTVDNPPVTESESDGGGG